MSFRDSSGAVLEGEPEGVGTYEIVVTGKGPYIGTVAKTFKVVDKKLLGEAAFCSHENKFFVEGDVPEFEMRDYETDEALGSDAYHVTSVEFWAEDEQEGDWAPLGEGEKPTRIGRYQYTVEGMGDYMGQYAYSFEIVAANSVKLAKVEVDRDQPASEAVYAPAVRVLFGDAPLEPDKDYTVSYARELDYGDLEEVEGLSVPGSYVVTVKGANGAYVDEVEMFVTVHAFKSISASDVAQLESEHDYDDYSAIEWVYADDRASNGFVIAFDDQTHFEDGFDCLYILDGSDAVIGCYSGDELSGQTVDVPGGSSFKIRLVSDASGTDYGFKVTSVLPKVVVVFKGHDDAELSRAEYVLGTKAADIEAPATPTREGDEARSYVFCGWSPALADVDFGVGIESSEVVYTATYREEAKYYTVTFVDESGKRISRAEYPYGTDADGVAKPDDPKKESAGGYDYAFGGWRAAGAKDVGVSAVTGGATYWPVFTANAREYTISYGNLKEAANTDNPSGYSVGNEDDVVLKSLDGVEGFTFAGWYLATDVTQVGDGYVANEGAAPVQMIAKEDARDYALVAVWTPVTTEEPAPTTWTVAFNAKGGSAIEPVVVENGSTVAKPADPARDGYAFDGWKGLDGAAFDFTNPITGNTTVIASWKLVEYAITYDFTAEGISGFKGGLDAQPANAYDVTSADILLPTADDVTLEQDYVFGGWYLDAGFTQRAGNAVPSGSTGDKKLYAKAVYTKSTEVKTADTDAQTKVSAEGETAFKVDQVDKDKGREVVLEVEKTASADEQSQSAEEKQAVSDQIKVVFENKIGDDQKESFAAKEPIATYNVELELQEPTGETVRTLSEDYEVGTLKLKFYVGAEYAGRVGSIFHIHTGRDGAVTTTEHSFVVDDEGYVECEVNRLSEFVVAMSAPVEVVFDGNGGTPATTKASVNVGSTVIAPTANPTRDGYDFTGWYSDKECTATFNFTSTVEEGQGITLYAGWKKRESNPTKPGDSGNEQAGNGTNTNDSRTDDSSADNAGNGKGGANTANKDEGTAASAGAKAGSASKTTPTAGTAPASKTASGAAAATTGKVGSTAKVGGLTYKVTATGSSAAVSFTKASKSKKAITVPATVKVNGKKYAVKGIAKGAFKGSKAKTVTIKSKKLTKKSVKGCFKGSKVKTVKVPKSKLKAYKKIFTKANCGKKVRLVGA